MRRLLVVLLFLLCLAPLSSIAAETQTYTVGGQTFTTDFSVETPAESGAGDENALPGQRVRVDGDLVNPTFTPGTDTRPCHIDQETGDLSCVNSQTHTRDDRFSWGPTDAKSYNLTDLKNILEGARLPLTPQTIWDITTRNTNPQWDSWIARACDFKKQDDNPPELLRNELSREMMNLGPDLNVPPTVENLEYYKSIYSTLKNSDQNYQKATELVKLGTAYECNYTKEAVKVKGGVKESQGQGIWDIIRVIFHTIFFDLSAKNNSYKIITETARKPYSEEIAGGLIQATEEILSDSRVDEDRKKRIMADAGIVETFRPCSIQFEGPEKNGEVTNEYQWLQSGETFDIESRQHLTKLWDEATLFFQSTLLPGSLQSEGHKQKLKTKPCGGKAMEIEPVVSNVDNPPAPSCKDGIDEPGFERKPGNLSEAIKTAAAGKIPECVLQGVADIEGAEEEIASGKCSPNECSATGPFQITVGFTYGGSGASCQKDTTCAACGLSECPNAVQDYVPGTNPCDTQSAANAAVSMLMGKSAYFGKPLDMSGDKDAIIVAGDSYYGASVPISRFGGCSYGEWIYKDACGHADYVCSSHQIGN